MIVLVICGCDCDYDVQIFHRFYKYFFHFTNEFVKRYKSGRHGTQLKTDVVRARNFRDSRWVTNI